MPDDIYSLKILAKLQIIIDSSFFIPNFFVPLHAKLQFLHKYDT